MAKWNARTRCPIFWCNKTLSRGVDLERHLKTHTKGKKDLLYCWGCPLMTIQKANLEKHIKDHHSGDEKYKCADPSGCQFGANSKGAINFHRKKYHDCVPPERWEIRAASSEAPAYERGTIIESSSSSLSYASNTPATSLDETPVEEFSPPTLLNHSALDMRSGTYTTSVSSQAVATDMEQFLCTSLATGSQQSDKRALPEAKVLYPAMNVGPPLDIGLEPLSSHRGCLAGDVSGSLGAASSPCVGTTDSYGSTMDVAAIASTFSVSVPVQALPGPIIYQQAQPHLVYPVPTLHFTPAYNFPDPMGSTMDANTFNDPSPAYATSPSGYGYEPQSINAAPSPPSVPIHAYSAPHQTYQTVSWDASNLAMPQQPVDNALFSVPEQRPWMPTSWMLPLSNDVSEYAFPNALGSFDSGAYYEGNHYH
ncbi:uncharacterized protein BT62DRAFT_992695 [Guyanagaster necrorhizus]|uniref:C2H2-type domain-containing protein n=1 Tax=Guyanagaster necrorhizus TaxID=856835 RepID=A0A9P7VYB3_9AGAR|nr:uncharacterized protein BT62DRAFT_992695 [Guyanagaster necrorhizus MCA 3950]KAG7448695.1 hypothetical protein BT62DRAFT_992695 [Guyanagaster necrorhizus MCA 3950]